MSLLRTKIMILAGFSIILAVIGFTIYTNEKIIRYGKPLFLELAPVDPRSLMQGDYMALRFAIESQLHISERVFDDVKKERENSRQDGYLILSLDKQGVGQLKDLVEHYPSTLGKDEIVIRYRVRHNTLKIATNAFFFQEGRAEEFDRAQYGEFRVGENGEPRLIAMRDREFVLIGSDIESNLNEDPLSAAAP